MSDSVGSCYFLTFTHEEAREYIRQQSGTQFDPDVVKVFLSIKEEEWQLIRGEQLPYRARPPSNASGQT